MHTNGFTPMEDALLNYGTIVFVLASIIEAAFLVHYIVVAPAFKSWIGWMFVLRSASFFFAGITILAGRILGPGYWARPYLTFGLYVLVLFSACVTYGTFLRERAKGRGEGRPPRHSVLSWTRRALGLKGHRREKVVADSEAESRLRIVEDQTA